MDLGGWIGGPAGASVKRVEIIESLERRSYLSPLIFSQPVAFATGSNPSDVVTSSLTRNGIQDVVTSNFGSASVSVLRGNGNGTFQSPVFYAVGNAPEALAAGDFNGDGIPDIVTANEGSNTISLLLGNGDGTFAPQVTYPVGIRPEAIAVADLTGDGHLDIVTANEGSNTISVLINNGDGTFAPAVSYFIGDQPDGVAIGDFNGDGKPDIVAVTPLNNNLHILLNDGNGTFGHIATYDTGLSARAVTVADLNSDGRPDIIVTNLHSTDISILDGVGDGTFQPQQNYPTGGFPFSVTVADLNGDGRPDIITANNVDNGIGVLIHDPTGGFSTSKPYRGGSGPVAAAVADVNGDGKPDVIVADFNTSKISVLTNQTIFVPLVPTTITLTPGQNPVEVNNRLQLSVKITPSLIKVRKPIGVVQFFNGDAVIGVVDLSASGVATIYTNKLALGTHTITAHYGGDGIYAGILSAAVTEVVVPATAVSPLVAPTLSSVRLPPQYVAGDRGIVNLAIEDIGDGPARGVVHVQLFASLSNTFDATAFPVAINGNSNIAVSLLGGRVRLIGLNFTVPANLAAGNYTYFAALAPVSGLSSAQVSAVPAVGINTAQSVLEFGTVGAHRGYKLARTLANGTAVTVQLTGPGTGVFTEDPTGGISLAINGTNGASKVTIVSNGVTLDSLSSTGTLGSINAPTTTANGPITLNQGLGKFTLAGATNSSILIAGGPPNQLSLGNLSGVTIYSAAAIQSLKVASYTDTAADSITTAYIGTLQSTDDFGASLTLNGGAGGRNLGLRSATIGGTLLDSTWSIQANVGSVTAGGVAAGWSGSIHGTLGSFIDTGDFAGNLAARDIGSLKISGSLTSASIFAGANFGPSARLGSPGNFFGSGVLTSIIVNGNVTNSLVAAGDVPTTATLLGRSAIRSISVSGSLDSSSVFTAVSLPVTARVAGQVIATVGDPHFVR